MHPGVWEAALREGLQPWEGAVELAGVGERVQVRGTLDGGLGLAVEMARGAERATGAGHGRCHPHAHPIQFSKAVRERLGLVFQLLPVPSRFPGSIHSHLDGSVVGGHLGGVGEHGDGQCETLPWGE